MADSLAAFAAASVPARAKCVVCDLPPDILKQVDAAPEQGISYPTIEKWLQSLGHSATRHQLGRHRSHTPVTS